MAKRRSAERLDDRIIREWRKRSKRARFPKEWVRAAVRRVELAQNFRLASKLEANIRPRLTFQLPWSTTGRAGAGNAPANACRQRRREEPNWLISLEIFRIDRKTATCPTPDASRTIEARLMRTRVPTSRAGEPVACEKEIKSAISVHKPSRTKLLPP